MPCAWMKRARRERRKLFRTVRIPKDHLKILALIHKARSSSSSSETDVDVVDCEKNMGIVNDVDEKESSSPKSNVADV